MASKLALRLVSFEHLPTKSFKVGAQIKDNNVVDLTAALGIKDMKTLLQERSLNVQKWDDNANFIITSGKSVVFSKDLKLRAPISNPDKILCIGLNYVDHAIESNMPIPGEPVCFSKFVNTICGPEDDVIKPNNVKEFDYEAELVAVIGKEARHVKEEDALDYVAGYTCGNDVSARDWQIGRPGGQWLLGKSFDTFAPIGPAIVTKVSNPNALGIRAVLNGQSVQNSSTKQFIFNLNKVIAWVSKTMTLKPGDLIFTGTPPGVGMGRNPKLWMKVGDKVTIEIDEIGSLTNNIIAEK